MSERRIQDGEAAGTELGLPGDTQVAAEQTADASPGQPTANGSQHSSELETVTGTEGVDRVTPEVAATAQDDAPAVGCTTNTTTAAPVEPTSGGSVAASSPSRRSAHDSDVAATSAQDSTRLTTTAGSRGPASTSLDARKVATSPSLIDALSRTSPSHLRAGIVLCAMLLTLLAYCMLGAAMISPDWISCHITNALLADSSSAPDSSSGSDQYYFHSRFRFGMVWSEFNVTEGDQAIIVRTPRNVFDFSNFSFPQPTRVLVRDLGNYDTVSERVAELGDRVLVDNGLVPSAIVAMFLLGFTVFLAVVIHVVAHRAEAAQRLSRLYGGLAFITALTTLVSIYTIVVGTSQLILSAFAFSQTIIIVSDAIGTVNPNQPPHPVCSLGIAQRSSVAGTFFVFVASFLFGTAAVW